MNQTVDKTEAQENDSEQSQTAPEIDYEAEAAKMGHSPKEKWRGDPDKWVDAKTFYERGTEILPIVKQQLRAEREKVEKIQQDVLLFKQHLEKTSKAELEAKIKELREQKKEAIDNADGAKVVQLDEQIDKLKETKVETSTPVHPAFPTWLKENPWYQADSELKAEADGIAIGLAQRGIQGQALFDAVTERIQKLFPDKFEEKKEIRGAQRPGGQPPKAGSKSYEALPADAKAAFKRFFDNKFYGKATLDDAKKKYASEYFAGEQ